VTGTVAAAAAAGALLVTPAAVAAPWVASGYALTVASRSAVSMVKTLRSGTWGIDVLAISAIVSTVVLGDYWAALVVVLMLTSGQALEDFAQRRARTELTALMERAPRTAHRAVGHSTSDVSVDDLVPGDILEVRPGEAVAVDGQVLEPGADFDESSITGESLPVHHDPGSSVLSGAVNGSSVIRVQATATAENSQFQTIIDLVRRAADSKAPFVRLADRVAVPFTAVALLTGVAAWFVSGDPARLAEVLVVATPCPLLIATPVAFIAAMSRAASRGIIVKGGGVLEQLARVMTVAFDKTGTLTEGAARVDRIETVAGTEAELLFIAATLEVDSAHVLARAIVNEASRRGIRYSEAEGVREVTAQGIEGSLRSSRIAAGKREFVAAGSAPGWVPLAAGETTVHISKDDRLLGRIVLRDEMRTEAPNTLRRLRAMGAARVVMLTGYAEDTARRVAEKAGIGEVRSSLLPEEKVAAVASLAPRPVVMVGDGINDAPVLAAADVGIAMGARGATAASESADVVILVDNLERVADIVAISQRTLRIAYQSIGLGIGLSVALMIIATTGVLPAIVGATLQEAVDVITILNSLRAGWPHSREPIG
jgi:heavy metal translocating P-type ATPase